MKDIIDYGEIHCPVSWDEITLKTFQEIERYYDNEEKKFDIRDILTIVTEKDEDYINSLPFELTEIILDKLSFLEKAPTVKEPTNSIVIDGEKYSVHFQNQLKTGEFIAADSILKSDKHNYAALLAILCRKEGELYDSKFENEILEDRIKLFEQQPITSILPIVNFFLHLYIILEIPTQLSLQVAEEINHIQQHITNLRKSGDLSAHVTKRLTKELRKLKESIKFI